MRNLVFVDCEAFGGCPATGQLTEFGAVTYPEKKIFHGVILKSRPSKENPAIPEPVSVEEQGWPEGWTLDDQRAKVFKQFSSWLRENIKGRPIFVSDNVAYDWQWINDGFWRVLNSNPFGFSGRRISDFYAGLTGDWNNTQKWKRLRRTVHDHNPVNDAMGNVEAFDRIIRGQR